MANEKKVTVRFDEESYERLTDGVKALGYRNISELVRGSLSDTLDSKGIGVPYKKVELCFSNKEMADIQEVIEMGYAVDIGDLVRHASKEYVKKRKNQTKLDDYKI